MNGWMEIWGSVLIVLFVLDFCLWNNLVRPPAHTPPAINNLHYLYNKITLTKICAIFNLINIIKMWNNTNNILHVLFK